MFCPKCGAADQATDSFCKRCGEWLPDTSRLGRRRGRIRVRTPEQRNRRMRILEVASAISAFSSAAIILAFLAGALDRPHLVLALDLCVVTALFQVVNFFIGSSLQKRLKQSREETDKSINLGAGTVRPQLDRADTSNLAQPSSVTESTTALLDPVPRAVEEKKDNYR